jgi:hypothetical protein
LLLDCETRTFAEHEHTLGEERLGDSREAGSSATGKPVGMRHFFSEY